MRMFAWLCVVCVVASVVVADESKSGTSGGQIAMFLKDYQQEVSQLVKVANDAYWKASISGSEDDFKQAAEKSLAISTYHSDAKRYAALKAAVAADKNASPLDARAAEVALRSFAQSQLPHDLLKKMTDMSSELEQVFQTYRGKIGDKTYTNNELLDILQNETDSNKRRAAWEALKQVGEEVNARIVALAKVRNEAARKLGFKNYWEMSVHFQDYTAAELLAIFEELDKTTAPIFTTMKKELDAELAERYGVAVDELMPWHYDNPFFQQAPPSKEINPNKFYEGKTREEIAEISRKYFASIGLPVESIMANSSLYEQEGKSQHAFCIDMDTLGDVRILCNLKPTAEWMDTQLHELGHAVYSFNCDQTLPFNLRDSAHIFTTEGVAMMFGALARTPQWMIAWAGIDADKANAAAAALKKQRVREQLIFCRWALVMLAFEKSLYENPDQDLKKLWWDIVERYQQLRRPPERDLADWASKPHFVIAPVYYHNYMLGELYAAQLRSVLAGKDGAAMGQYLKENVFAPGASIRWAEFVEKTTGKPLGAKAFGVELNAK
ncbi:MAG: M2 family metallopeptidase [Thermoguttaceae bacterium]